MQNVWFNTFTNVHSRFKTALDPIQKGSGTHFAQAKILHTVLVHFGRSDWCFDRENSLPYFNGNGSAEP